MLAALARCRVVLGVLLLLGFGLIETPQAIDLLITLGQDGGGAAWTGFALGTVWLAANARFWSRFALDGFAAMSIARARIAQLLPRLLGAAAPAVIAVALWHAARFVPAEMVAEMGSVDAGPGRLRAAVWALALLAAGAALLPLGGQPGRGFGGAAGAMLLLSTAAALAGLAAFGRDPVAAADRLPAASIVLFAAAGMICGGTLVLELGRRTRIPLLFGVFALAATLALLRDRDIIPDTHDLRLATAPLPDRPGIAAAFSAFLDATAPGFADAPIPVVLVASSGGGLAAAYWTATVLGDLADSEPRLAGQVFAASGVSGGALGLLAYTAGRSALPGCPTQRARPCLQAMLHRDFLGPTLGALLYPDLLQRFLPVPVFADRAAALETAWEASWRDTFGADQLARPFLDLWAPGRPWPALLLNGTSLTTGGRLLVSNLALRDSQVAEPRADLLAVLGADVPASTAAGVSARFPYIGPLGVLRGPATAGAAADAVGDGGYFENFGATTLLELLELLDTLARGDGRAVRFVVLQLISDPDNRAEGDGPPPPMPASASLLPRGLAGPATLLLRTRSARGLQAATALARRTLALGGTYIPVRLGRSPTGATAPLGWALSEVAVGSIDAQWTPSCRERLLAEAGFSAAPGPAPREAGDMFRDAECAPARH